MPHRSQSLPLQHEAAPPTGSPTPEGEVDSSTEDIQMEDALAISPPSTAHNRPQRRSVREHTQHEAPDMPLPRHGERVRAFRGRNHDSQQPSRVRNNPSEQLSAREVANLRALLDKYEGTHDWADSLSDKIDSLLNSVGIIEDNVRDLYETARPLPYADRSIPRDRDAPRPSRGAHRHHPYPGTGRTPSVAVRPARHIDSSRTAPSQAPVRETMQNTMITRTPATTVDAGVKDESPDTSVASPPPPAVPPAPAIARPSTTPAGPNQARSTRSGRRALVPMDQYRWVNQGTGLTHFLSISPAGLPMFPGHIAQAFQALQGPNPSRTELTRRIWLLYRGRTEGDIWKNAVAATREAGHKVILPKALELLLELNDLPRNEWEKITHLWSISATPLSAISPGIRLNPNGFAGLDNADIDTADLIHMWTSGNLKQVSKACGQEKSRSDVKSAFHIAITTPNLWTTGAGTLQPWIPSTNLRRLRYVGNLDTTTIANWLRNEVGLTFNDVTSRFRPFALRAFEFDAVTNPRRAYTDLVSPEIHPGLTDDSLPEFGADLGWTPAHGPHGPPLKSRETTEAGQPDASQGTADAIDTPMEA